MAKHMLRLFCALAVTAGLQAVQINQGGGGGGNNFGPGGGGDGGAAGPNFCSAGEYNADVIEQDGTIRPLGNSELCLTVTGAEGDFIDREDLEVRWSSCVTGFAAGYQKWVTEDQPTNGGFAVRLNGTEVDPDDEVDLHENPHDHDLYLTVKSLGSLNSATVHVDRGNGMKEASKQTWEIVNGSLCLRNRKCNKGARSCLEAPVTEKKAKVRCAKGFRLLN